MSLTLPFRIVGLLITKLETIIVMLNNEGRKEEKREGEGEGERREGEGEEERGTEEGRRRGRKGRVRGWEKEGE